MVAGRPRGGLLQAASYGESLLNRNFVEGFVLLRMLPASFLPSSTPN